MAKLRNYQELIVWQKAMDLVIAVYQQTREFPREELYGLTNQLRRASVSIPSNIAEGQGRNTTGDFRQFLSIAYGSLQEVETQLLISGRLHNLNAEQLDPLGKVAPCGDVRDRLPDGPHPLAPSPARGRGGNRASGGGEGSTERVTHI